MRDQDFSALAAILEDETRKFMNYGPDVSQPLALLAAVLALIEQMSFIPDQELRIELYKAAMEAVSELTLSLLNDRDISFEGGQ